MKNSLALLFVIWVFLHTLRYFDYLEFDPTLGGHISNFISLYLIFFCIFCKLDKRPMYLRKDLLGLFLIPILSFLPCWIENGQSLVESSRVYLSHCLVLIYFVCHKYKIPESRLIKWITILAVVRTLIVIVQQYTYPTYWFAFRPEEYTDDGIFKTIEIRSGILRYYIEDTYLSMFIVFYYFQCLLQHFERKSLFLFIFGLVGVYLDQSRQFMFSTVIALVFVFIFDSNTKHKVSYSFFILFLGLFAYYNFDTLFGELAEKTANETNEDNIRVLSYTHYFFNFWGGPFSVIFGNGMPGTSSYGQECAMYMSDWHIHRSDIGIVGALNLFGITGVVCLLYFYFNLLIKRWKQIDSYIKMFFISTVVNLPLVSVYTQNLNFFVFWSFMIYLADISIKRNINQTYSIK